MSVETYVIDASKSRQYDDQHDNAILKILLSLLRLAFCRLISQSMPDTGRRVVKVLCHRNLRLDQRCCQYCPPRFALRLWTASARFSRAALRVSKPHAGTLPELPGTRRLLAEELPTFKPFLGSICINLHQLLRLYPGLSLAERLLDFGLTRVDLSSARIEPKEYFVPSVGNGG